MKPLIAVLLFFVGTSCSIVSAADSWVMRGYVNVVLTGPQPCGASAAGWRTTTLLHNMTDQPQRVRSVDVSIGGVPDGDIVLRPRESAPMIAVAPNVTETRLWFAHLDVPPGVVVENRLQYFPAVQGPCGAPRVAYHPPTWQLPVYAELRPAGKRQVHVGTDVQGGPMRINVGVFNAGTAAAAAHVEVRSARCGEVVAVRELQLGPNTLDQISIPVSASEACAPINDFVDPATYYTTVIVDQPSLSYVTTLSNTQEPSAPLTVAAQP